MLFPLIGGVIKLFLSKATWITGMKIQSAHGGDSKHGVKRLKIHWLESRNVWKSNAQEFLSNIYSTANWAEIPKDLNAASEITLHERITAPLVFKFIPILTDRISIDILESHEANQDAHINEVEVFSDCKLRLILYESGNISI